MSTYTFFVVNPKRLRSVSKMRVDVAIYRGRIASFMPRAQTVSGAGVSKCLYINLLLSASPRAFAIVSVMLLLSCAGDVESNPGPGLINTEKIDKLQFATGSLISS